MAVILQEDFRSAGAETILCTDDGSAGIHGFVTQPFSELAKQGGIDAGFLKSIPHIFTDKSAITKAPPQH